MTNQIQTLEEAKEFLKNNSDQGVKCPCCNQFYKLYSRPMYFSMAAGLINLFKLSKKKIGYYSIHEIYNNTHPGDWAKLRFWGLIEEKPKDKNETTTRTSGHWKITQKGSEFVLGKLRVPRKIILLNNNLLGYDGPEISIQAVLGKEYNYREIMASYFDYTEEKQGKLL